MTSVTIILFEITNAKLHFPVNRCFCKDRKTLMFSEDNMQEIALSRSSHTERFPILFFLTSCCVNSLILPCTHLLFTSQSISISITLYTPVVYQSVHIYLYYPVHTCCLPVSPYLSILPCTHLLFTSQSISSY